MISRSLASALAALAAFAALGLAAPAVARAAPAHRAHPDFSGFWEPDDKSKLPREPTPYTADIASQVAARNAKVAAGQVVGEESAFCLPAGMPFMMSGSEGFSLRQTRDVIVILNEERPSPRHIYLDGRGHPDPAVFDVTTTGHSVGHWEGDSLVVDTVGFRPGFTAGLVRSEATHLVERYQFTGKQLKITFTWTDPKTLTKPWTYVYMMNRAPKDRYALEYYCDPSDPLRTSENHPAK